MHQGIEGEGAMLAGATQHSTGSMHKPTNHTRAVTALSSQPRQGQTTDGCRTESHPAESHLTL